MVEKDEFGSGGTGNDSQGGATGQGSGGTDSGQAGGQTGADDQERFVTIDGKQYPESQVRDALDDSDNKQDWQSKLTQDSQRLAQQKKDFTEQEELSNFMILSLRDPTAAQQLIQGNPEYANRIQQLATKYGQPNPNQQPGQGATGQFQPAQQGMGGMPSIGQKGLDSNQVIKLIGRAAKDIYRLERSTEKLKDKFPNLKEKEIVKIQSTAVALGDLDAVKAYKYLNMSDVEKAAYERGLAEGQKAGQGAGGVPPPPTGGGSDMGKADPFKGLTQKEIGEKLKEMLKTGQLKEE